MSQQTLAQSRGRCITQAEPFPAVIWTGGATDTDDGREFKGNLGHFVMLLTERATKIAPKREGWVLEPVTNPQGIRKNENTLAMHALFLDCDGTGHPTHLLQTLDYLGYAYVCYQSGGYTSAKPKWRIVLPLDRPYNTSSEIGRRQWKTLYNHCRVVFGSVAQLISIGFDPATETPCCPWFLTEKRDVADPVRQIFWREGHSLDLISFALALPEWNDEDADHDDNEGHVVAERVALDDDRLEEIVSTLARATNRVSSGRRDIYLSLPGVLLDRGIEASLVLKIVTEVSVRYPRHHPEKHADNIHCAKTTISKWEGNGAVTRIGTLNSVAPEVALAVDEVLPSGDEKFRLMALALIEGREFQAKTIAGVTELATSTDDDEVVEDWQVPVTHRELRKAVMSLRRRKKALFEKEHEVKIGIQWTLLNRVIEREALCAPIEADATTQMSALEMLTSLTGMLAYRLPKNTPFDAVKELVRGTLSAMLQPKESVDPWFDTMKKIYTKSLTSKLESESKKAEELAADREFARQYAWRGGVL